MQATIKALEVVSKMTVTKDVHGEARTSVNFGTKKGFTTYKVCLKESVPSLE